MEEEISSTPAAVASIPAESIAEEEPTSPRPITPPTVIPSENETTTTTIEPEEKIAIGDTEPTKEEENLIATGEAEQEETQSKSVSKRPRREKKSKAKKLVT